MGRKCAGTTRAPEGDREWLRVAQPRWTEAKWAAPDSNRSLSTHDFGGPAIDPSTAFDGAENCVKMPHLRALGWDTSGRLTRTVIIERTYYFPDDAEFAQSILDEVKTCYTSSDPEVVRRCALKVTAAAIGTALKVDKKEVGPDGRDSKFGLGNKLIDRLGLSP